MKTITFPLFFLTTISMFIFNFSVQGQVTDSVASGRNDAKTQEAVVAEARSNQLIVDAGRFFIQGLLNMQDNRRPQAGEDFNKSVETFLMSGVNVSRNPKLQSCYNQLIETIYRIEFPSNAQQPQIRSLSATCNWKWGENDYKLADAVAKIILTAPTETAPSNGLVTSPSPVATNAQTRGYNEQKFEASPLDELAKLEPTASDEIVLSKIAVPKTNYSRPLLNPIVQTASVRVVKAKSGDTVTKLAEREGVSAVELAKYNGLLPTSILSAGREVKIPLTTNYWQNYARKEDSYTTKSKEEEANCKTSTSPIIQKLRLGMTINEVSKKLGNNITVKKVPNSSPETYFAQVSNLKGVKQLSLNFFRDEL